MEHKNKRGFNLVLLIITVLIISSLCYLGVIFTSSVEIAKVEKNNYLKVEEDTLDEKTNRTSTNSNTSKVEETEDTTQAESSNANLSMLGIRPTEYDFTGFKVGTTSYDVTVPNDVEEVEVYATAQDSKSKISGLGTKKLTEGLNDLSIVVTAEDGTEKIYTINVTREGATSSNEGETTDGETTSSGEGLSSLKIGDLELSPAFSTNVYEYTAKYIGEGKEVNVDAVATNSDYTVEITGNDNLQEGENVVTILVTDDNGDNVATYQVTVNKSLVDEEAIAREQEEARKKQEQEKMIIIGVAVGVIVLIIVIAIIVSHRKKKKWEQEYTIPFSGLNYDNDEEQDYEVNNKQDEDDIEEQENNIYNNEDEVNWTKEEARKQFLDDYDNMYLDQERASRKKHKGKRFK